MMRLARAVRRRPQRRGEAALRAARHRGREVLGVQAAPAARRRGARVPRRQRLRRGVDPAAPLPRGAAQRDLGRLGQRRSASTCCAPWGGARVRRGVLRRDRAGPRRRRPPRRVRRRACATTLADFDATRATGPAARRAAWRWRCRRSLLVRHGHPAVADAFCASRLAGDRGVAFGTLRPRYRLHAHHRASAAGDRRARLTSQRGSKRSPSGARTTCFSIGGDSWLTMRPVGSRKRSRRVKRTVLRSPSFWMSSTWTSTSRSSTLAK